MSNRVKSLNVLLELVIWSSVKWCFDDYGGIDELE